MSGEIWVQRPCSHVTCPKFPNQENFILVLFTVSPLPKPYPQHTNMFSFLMNNTDVFSHKQMRIFILRNDIHFSGYWYSELLLTNTLFVLFFKQYTFPWVWLAYLISYWEEETQKLGMGCDGDMIYRYLVLGLYNSNSLFVWIRFIFSAKLRITCRNVLWPLFYLLIQICDAISFSISKQEWSDKISH